MTIETNGRRINIDIDPLLFLIFLGDKVDKKIINEIATPDFSIVVRRSRRKYFKAKEGDYDIIIRKDNGEEVTLNMPHRGSKMLYMLTLLCQKVVGGLPNRYFNNKRAASAIVTLFDKLYRSGGEQWVANCVEKTHNLSTFRTHANGAIESNTDLDDITRYWCGFESEKRTVGENQLQLRRIRVPNERIVFEDADNEAISFQDIMEQLPPLAELFGFRNRNTEYLRDLRKKGGDGVYVYS